MGSSASRWLTDTIRRYLPDAVPFEQRKTVSSVSLRVASVTEMAAANVGFWASHARSGHKLPLNQENYWDREDPFSSLVAAKSLAGWDDCYAEVQSYDV